VRVTTEERLAQAEARLAKVETALAALAATFQRVAELVKGIGTKAAEAADTIKSK